jgi:hypothetical protein
MRVLAAAIVLFSVLSGGGAAAESVPLPRSRPSLPPPSVEPHSFAQAIAGLAFDPAEASAEPTACDRRLAAIAAIEPMPRLIGPGACGGRDMVRVQAVVLADATRATLTPAPLLRCAMAEALATWLRQEAAPAAAALGSGLRVVETYDDYECRSRNRRPGAKLSEHAGGNAVDVRAFRLADGRVVALTDAAASPDFRTVLRDSACRRFTTVLGPGDPYHADHIHLDIAERHGGYRICQWELFGPPAVPLPRPRPLHASVH